MTTTTITPEASLATLVKSYRDCLTRCDWAGQERLSMLLRERAEDLWGAVIDEGADVARIDFYETKGGLSTTEAAELESCRSRLILTREKIADILTTGPRSVVSVQTPRGPGTGMIREWTRTLGGTWYLFRAVTTADGDRSYFVFRVHMEHGPLDITQQWTCVRAFEFPAVPVPECCDYCDQPATKIVIDGGDLVCARCARTQTDGPVNDYAVKLTPASRKKYGKTWL